jgi:hypothetical protein
MRRTSTASSLRSLITLLTEMHGGICELAAENGASGGCFQRPFHHNMKNVNVLKEDKMISSAFSVFSNVEVLGALLEQQLHNRLVPMPALCGPR